MLANSTKLDRRASQKVGRVKMMGMRMKNFLTFIAIAHQKYSFL
jgi:hypothetical protein